MAKNLLESEELREIWAIKDEVYQEVAGCKTIPEMVSKRITMCKSRARLRKVKNKETP